MESLIQLVIYLVILGLVVWLLFYVLSRVSMPEPARTAIVVIAALVILLWFLRYSGILAL